MEFAATREVLASLYDETPTATFLCDRGGRVLRANPAAEALVGCEPGELAGRQCATLAGEGEKLRAALAGVATGDRSRFELEILRQDGTNLPVDCEVFPARIGEHVAGAFVQARAQWLATSDALTGLPSRVLFVDRVEQTLMAGRRYDYRFALMHADIDGFTEIVARVGTAGADEVLCDVARRVRETLRGSDTLVRVGPDRFAILQPMIESADDAVDVAHKIVFAMQAPVTVSGRALDVRVSIGIAIFPTDGETRDELAAAADRALREAKRLYRGLFRLATTSSLEPAR
jgi:diguanylate cyclase (GGDEF)-like protein/PAS domain S-box-containing protein